VVDGTLPMFGMLFREQIGLRRAVEKDNVDIMHFPCNTAPIDYSGPFVLTLHDTIQLSEPQGFAYARGLAKYKRAAISSYSSWTIRKTAAKARAIITVSNYEKTRIAQLLGIALNRIHVTYLAPNALFARGDLNSQNAWRHEVRQRFGIHERFVLSIGYEPRKNIPTLIEAWSLLASDFPDVRLVIVAAESQSQTHFRRLAQDKGIGERVTIMGSVAPEDLAILYNLSEVFTFASERESFGLPPLEALACGTPVVAMRATSTPEILQDGALLVDGKRPADWAAALMRVLSDSNLHSRLMSAGAKQTKRFSWQHCAEETMRIYYASMDAHRCCADTRFE
jgi:glycosyltransferase involved in cell wall biosynthesis